MVPAAEWDGSEYRGHTHDHYGFKIESRNLYVTSYYLFPIEIPAAAVS